MRSLGTALAAAAAGGVALCGEGASAEADVLEARDFAVYPGYQGPLLITGVVKLGDAASGKITVDYRLRGVDRDCGHEEDPARQALPNHCGIHVHDGTSCADALGHLYNMSVDPWMKEPVYQAHGTLLPIARAKLEMDVGYSAAQMVGKLIVVHDTGGRRASCAQLVPTPSSALETWHTDGTCYSEANWRSQSWLNYSGAFARCGPSLVCVEDHDGCEDMCITSEECENFPMRVCNEETHKCTHKGVFANSAGRDVGAALLFCCISALALAAGIGGGGLYVPLLMIILGFGVREATGLSQSCLAGGSSSALLYNLRQRHPTRNRPMIDYRLVLIMGPNLLSGAIVGTFLNSALPSWLILLLLTVILTHSAFKTFKKAVATLRKERAGNVPGMQGRGNASSSSSAMDRCLQFVGVKRYAEFDDSGGRRESPKAAPAVVGAPSVEAGEIKLELADAQTAPSEGASNCPSEPSVTTADQAVEEKQYPRGKLAGFAFMWVVVVISIFARGGRAVSGMVSHCSPMYWLFSLMTLAILLSLALKAMYNAVRRDAQRMPDSSPQSPGGDEEMRWTRSSATRVALWSLFAGTLAALCGIGGGMVMGPKLLELGFIPQVQSATTATTLFVMSTSTALAFLVQGTAPLDYALFLGFFTACGAVVGKAIFTRPSVIMFLLGGIIAASVLMMSITGLLDVVDDIQQGNDLWFQNPCAAD